MHIKNKIILIIGIITLLTISFNKVNNYPNYSYTDIITETNEFKHQINQELFKGDKLTTKFKAKYNHLGTIYIFFNIHNQNNDDYLQFKIKETDSDQWYYSYKYKVDQFQNNKYFPFGFPIINNSKNKEYQIEIESLSETKSNSVKIITEKFPFLSKYTFTKTYLLQNKWEIPTFIFNKIYSYFKHIQLREYLYVFGISIFLMYLIKYLNIYKLSNIIIDKSLISKPFDMSHLSKIISYLIASTISISIFYIKNTEIINMFQSVSTNTNMILFVLSIILFCSIFLIFYLISQKISQKIFLKNYFLSRNISNLIIFAIFCLFLWLIWLISINSNTMVGYASLNSLSNKNIAFIILLIYLLVYIFRKSLNALNLRKINKKFWIITALITTTIVSYFFYAPNGLLYGWNYGAYYNSIYVHQQGIPYSEKFISIYGHYAILLRPIFNIIGINLYTIATITAFIGFISILSVIYTMYILINKPFIRLLGLGTILFPFAGFLPIPYPQTYPHRLLFPSIIMALGAYLIKNKKNKLLIIIGYTISSLAIIWNSDTGIICLIAWGSLHTYLLFNKNKFKVKDCFKFIIPLSSMIISFYSSWGIVSLYNIIIGGKALNLYYFLFPLLENTYMYTILHTKIPLNFAYWVPIIILFYYFISRGITSTSFFVKKIQFNKNIALTFFISVIGIGQMMYFMNRCAYFNILPCYYQALLLLLIVLEDTSSTFLKNKKNISDTIKSAIFYCTIGILIALITILFINISNKISSMKQYYNMDMLYDMTNYINNTIEKDTPIVSINTTPFSIALGWKNELGFTDLQDLFLNTNKEIVINTLINYNKPFLIEKGYYEYFGGIPGVFYIPACDNFKKIKDKYNIQELTGINKIHNKYYNVQSDQSIFLYLTPKK